MYIIQYLVGKGTLMKNKAAVIITGFAFAVSAVSSVAVYEAINEENERVAFVNSYDVEYVSPSELSLLYDVDMNELCAGYERPSVHFGKVLIDVPVINQYPELPSGCEITSAAAYLNYLGIDIDKVELQKSYLPDSFDFEYFTDGSMRKGPDPSVVFVGYPEENGFGCFNTVIIKSLNTYFSDNSLPYEAITIDGATQADLERLLDYGIPVEVWASKNMMPFKYTDDNKWRLNTTGEEFCWPKNSHTLILCGYNEKDYFFSDCNDKNKIVAYKKTDFLARWKEFGSQGLIIIRTEN